MGNSSSQAPSVTVESRSPAYYEDLAERRQAAAKQNNEPRDSIECKSRICNSDDNRPSAQSDSTSPCLAYSHSVCPLNRAELGRASWAFLHTLAAFYPDQPSRQQQAEMNTFIHSYSKFYPCGYCADRTNEELIRNPPRVSSQRDFSVWMCEIHNEVNERIHKPIFDCNLTDLRWKYGIKGKCD